MSPWEVVAWMGLGGVDVEGGVGVGDGGLFGRGDVAVFGGVGGLDVDGGVGAVGGGEVDAACGDVQDGGEGVGGGEGVHRVLLTVGGAGHENHDRLEF
jgi:hypothetical protein